jgi:ABC-type multidrug transport system ATPase subunit
MTAVLGQSGSGKTSLLDILSGYTKNISSGRVMIGDDVNDRDCAKRSKYIMQNYSLHRFITVREAMNFAANLKLHGVSDTCKNYKVSE